MSVSYCYREILPAPAGFELVTPWLTVEVSTNWVRQAGKVSFCSHNIKEKVSLQDFNKKCVVSNLKPTHKGLPLSGNIYRATEMKILAPKL